MDNMVKEAYCVEKDDLIYDYLRLIDSKNVTVTLDGGSDGCLERGQVIDFDSVSGSYKPHKSGGAANCIVAADTAYTSEDTEITVTVYISGNFRQSRVLADVSLTAADLESLRSFEIVLK